MAALADQPNEDDLFDAYFRRADLDGNGRISGAETVSFFQGSGLPKQILAQIWAHTNQSQSGYLSREEFSNALKLVTVAQSKQELTTKMIKEALYGPASSKIPAPQFNFSPTVASPQGFSSGSWLLSTSENGSRMGPAADFSSTVPSFVSSVDDAMMSGTGAAYYSKSVTSFASSVDNAVMSGIGRAADDSNNVRSFLSSVDNGMMSRTGGGADDPNNVHSFVSRVEDALRSGIGDDNSNNFRRSFVSSVDDAIMSGTGAAYYSKSVTRFASSVDKAVMSGTGRAADDSNNVRSFVSSVDNGMMSRTGGGADDPNNVHSFVSRVEDALRSGIGEDNSNNFRRSFVSSVEDAMMSGTGGGGQADRDVTYHGVALLNSAMVASEAPNVDDLFDDYFRWADLNGDGRISGAEVVSFFQGSGLPKQVLTQIWKYTDQSQSGYLSREEFYNALKLVTVAQHKRELTPKTVKAALYGPNAPKIPAPQIHLRPTVASPQVFSSGSSLLSTVENALSSGPAADFSSTVPSFVSSVDDAKMSGTGAAYYSKIVTSFASSVDNGMMSGTGGAADDSNNVRSFVSSVDNAMRSGTGGGDEADTYRDLTMSLSDLGIARADAGHRARVTQGFRLFTMEEVVAATNNFSPNNKIGAGSFGVVYKGKLADGCEVAIRRREPGLKRRFSIANSSVPGYKLPMLSRLRHKHLVRLVGFYKEKIARALVYEYIKNGSLYDHLHNKSNVEKGSSVLNSWKMRIQIALDASRGIEYLHNCADPPIIHGKIKPSNNLLDDDWTARISDTLLPLSDISTAGYVDPDFFNNRMLTLKNDVYALGVVLLELLTGKEAIFKPEKHDRIGPISLVNFAVPTILDGELEKILDPKVGALELKKEAEAVKLVASTAMDCVKSKREDRPTIANVVANLERALATLEVSSELNEFN